MRSKVATGRRRPIGPVIVCLIAIVLAVAEAAGGGPLATVLRVGADGIDGTAGRAGATGSSTAPPGRSTGSDAIPRTARGDVAPTATDGSNTIGDAPRPVTGDGRIAPPPGSGPGALPPCTFDDLPAPRAGMDDWASTIVDTAYALPHGYRPPDLVPVGRADIGGWGLVRSFVIDDLRDLARAAAAAGDPLAVQSAFRSESRQAAVFAGWVARSGEAQARRFSARPGHSEHQLGTALDLRATAGGAPWTGAFGSTAAGRWLAKHAPEYGFVLSYPAGGEAITCYGGEAWHVRYVGRAVAARVAASGLPLRAWLWANALDH